MEKIHFKNQFSYSIQSESEQCTIKCLNDLKTNSVKEIFQTFDLQHHQFLCSSFDNKQTFKAKLFQKGSQGLLQIFTIQLLQLCCMQPKNDDQSQINYLQSICQLVDKPQFQLLFSKEENQLFTKTSQYILKEIIFQFLDILVNRSKNKNIKQIILYCLNQYPLVIRLFVAILRQLLYLGDLYKNQKTHLNMQSTFEFLACYFGVQASIDLQNNCVCFSKTNTYIYQQNQSIFYMINTEIKKQQIQTNGSDSSSSSSVHSSQFSQIDVQQFSSILNNKEQRLQQKPIKQETTVMISQLNIPSPSESALQNFRSQPSYKIVQSQIIQPRNSRINDNNKNKVNNDNDNDNESNQIKKTSTTTTYSQFAKNSLNQYDGSLKAYIQTPTTLQSQIVDTIRIHKLIQSKSNNFQKNKAMEIQKYYQIKQTKYLNNLNTQYYPPQRLSQPVRPKISTPKIFTTQHKLYQPYYIPQNIYQNKKFKPTPWINKNITKQFTSSKILQKLAEPYRSNIRQKKNKAREQRKNLYFMQNSFI